MNSAALKISGLPAACQEALARPLSNLETELRATCRSCLPLTTRNPPPMSLLRAFSALRLAPSAARSLSTAAAAARSSTSLLRPSPLLSLAARPSLCRTPPAPAPAIGQQQVRTFKMPKGARKFTAKSPLARGSAKTARKKGKRAVSSGQRDAGGVLQLRRAPNADHFAHLQARRRSKRMGQIN